MTVMRNSTGAVIVILVAAVSFGIDCTVTCPSGYDGTCIKSDNGCSCSCSKNAKDAILKALQDMKAPLQVQSQAKQLSKESAERPETTLTDPSSGQKFTMLVTKSK